MFVKPLQRNQASRAALVRRGSATELPWTGAMFDAVLTDPPYYDNVPYADVSDFFYVWLKRSVGHLHASILAAISLRRNKKQLHSALGTVEIWRRQRLTTRMQCCNA